MRHYIYTDGNAGVQRTHFAPRLGRDVPTTYHGQALGRASYGKPFPVREGKVVFECDAPDILSADQMLLQATGLVAAKEPAICVGFTDL